MNNPDRETDKNSKYLRLVGSEELNRRDAMNAEKDIQLAFSAFIASLRFSALLDIRLSPG
jgi:hypothetical protein